MEKKILDKNEMINDDFLDMSKEAKVLYMNLKIDKDEDNVVEPFSVMEKIEIKYKALKELIDNEYIVEVKVDDVIHYIMKG